MNICRLCMGTGGEIYMFDDSRTAVNTFLTYCKFKMDNREGLPEYSCLPCIQKLESVVTFMKQCEASDRVLRMNLDGDDIKEEWDIPLKDLQSFSLDYFSSDDDTYHNHDMNKDGVQNDDEEPEDFWAEFDDDTKYKPRKKQKDLKPSHYLCSYCGETFEPGHSTTFKNHILNNHAEKQFSCDKCPKTYHVKRSFLRHLNKCQNKPVIEKNFNCSLCTRRYATQTQLDEHININHKKTIKFPCDKCNTVFYREIYLKKHLRTVHEKKHLYSCTFCDKIMPSPKQLEIHTRVHTNERPFGCKFCESRFMTQRDLREHERIHTGETPFKCPICERGYAQRGNMKSHFKFNHREDNYYVANAAYRERLEKERQANKTAI